MTPRPFGRLALAGVLALSGVLVVAVAAPVLAQANSPGTPAGTPANSTLPGSLNPAPYRLPEVVANVNGTTITREEMDSELEKSREASGILFALIMARLADQRAQQLGLVPTRAQIDEAYQKAELQTRGQLANFLQTSHTSRAEFEQNVLKPQLEFDALSHQGVQVSDAELAAYIAGHRLQWNEPDLITLYRIHTSDLATARKVRDALRRGASWAQELKRSDDPPYYKDHDQGLYGEVTRRLLPPEIQAAVGTLKSGDISDPVAVPGDAKPGGYVIWRVAKVVHTEPGTDAIKADILRQKAKSVQDVMRELLKSANLTQLPDGFREQFITPVLAEQPPTPPRNGQAPPPGLPPPPPNQ